MTRLPSFDLDENVRAFRQEVRQWLVENWHGRRQTEHNKRLFKERGWDRPFSLALGKKGWIGLGWPKEFGGQARSPGEQLAFIEEMEYAQAPKGHIAAEHIVGPSLIRFGSREQQQEYLPRILAGDRTFALGYSEPEAGSDLAALKTKAEQVGDEWLINGQKVWSTAGDKGDEVWLAARTDPNAKPRHAGISMFLVSLKAPGVTVRPSLAMYGKTFSALLFDNVRVPANALVGEVNNGWKVITDALAAERVMIGQTVALLQRTLDQLTSFISASEDVVAKDGVIRDKIGSLAAEVEVARQFVLRNASMMASGKTPMHEAAMTKLFAGELQERLSEAALDILGTGGLLSTDAPSAPLGQMEQVLRHSIMGVIGGGTSEIQRNIIAIRGLGLPR